MKKLLLGIIAILFSFNGWAENEPTSNVCTVYRSDSIVTISLKKRRKAFHEYIDTLENCTDGQNLLIAHASQYYNLLFASYCDLNFKYYVGTPPGIQRETSYDTSIMCVFKNHGNGQKMKNELPLK